MIVTGIYAAIIVAIFAILYMIFKVKQESPNKEGYGGPPGMQRAVGLNDIKCVQDFIGADRVFHGNTASSISYGSERG